MEAFMLGLTLLVEAQEPYGLDAYLGFDLSELLSRISDRKDLSNVDFFARWLRGEVSVFSKAPSRIDRVAANVVAKERMERQAQIDDEVEELTF